MDAPLTSLDWAARLLQLGVDGSRIDVWAPLFAAHVQPDGFGQGAQEMDDFIGQILHESGMLAHIEENLEYSAARLTAVWPSRFPDLQAAEPFAFNPHDLANEVYGHRLGNTEPGDGWLYRGRGLIQVTGRANYQLVQDATTIPLVAHPDMLAQPEMALVVSKAWWDKKVPDTAVGDVARITRIVNGGLVGLADRQRLTDQAMEADA